MIAVEERVAVVENKVEDLDTILGQFIRTTGSALSRLEREMKDFKDEMKGLKLIPVYGGLSMNESTINFLTNNDIYGVIFKGDILEIPNFDDLKKV